MAVEDLLTDPKFLSLPLDAQLRISRQDQRFAALDPKVQGTILYHAKSTHLGQTQPTEEETKVSPITEGLSKGLRGFSQSYGVDPLNPPVVKPPGLADSIKEGLQNSFPVTQVPGMIKGTYDTGKGIYDDLKSGEFSHAVGTGLGLASQALVAKKIPGAAEEPLISPPVAKTGQVISAAGKGGIARALEPSGRGGLATLTGAYIGKHFFGDAGGFIGGALPFLRGAYEGGKAALSEPVSTYEPFSVKPSIKSKLRYTPGEDAGAGRSYKPVKIRKQADLSSISGEAPEEAPVGKTVKAPDELPAGHESWLNSETSGVDPGPSNIKQNITVDRTAKSNRLIEQIKKNGYEADKLPTSARDPFWKALTSETPGVNWNPSQDTVNQILRDLRRGKP